MNTNDQKAAIDESSQKMTSSIGIDNHPKAIRNFTDLPEPFYSQRGLLISNENSSNLVRQSENYVDRTNTITSLKSILSGSSIGENEYLYTYSTDGSQADESNSINGRMNPESESSDQTNHKSMKKESVSKNGNKIRTSTEAAESNYSNRPGSSEFGSSGTFPHSETDPINHQSKQMNLISTGGIETRRDLLPTSFDNPSTPTVLSHFTSESVENDNNDASDKSSDSEVSIDAEKSEIAMKKWIFVSIIVLFMYGLFFITCQAYQSLYVARNELNDKPIPSNQSTDAIKSFIDSYPENRVGLWMECTGQSCRDLELFCSEDLILKRLRDSGLITNSEPSELTVDFVKLELHICPMIKVSRFTSVFSIFAGVLVMIGLILAYMNNKKNTFRFIKVGGIIMVILTAISLSLFIAIKAILDNLVFLSKAYSETGSTTMWPNVDTSYNFSTSFWLCCLSLIIAVISVGLFFVSSKFADEARLKSKSDIFESDLYSISTVESIDVGPRVSTIKSDESSTFRFNESIHNLTLTSRIERADSFDRPPIMESKAVRFS